MRGILADVADTGVQPGYLQFGLAPIARSLDLAGQGARSPTKFLQVLAQRLRAFDDAALMLSSLDGDSSRLPSDAAVAARGPAPVSVFGLAGLLRRRGRTRQPTFAHAPQGCAL